MLTSESVLQILGAESVAVSRGARRFRARYAPRRHRCCRRSGAVWARDRIVAPTRCGCWCQGRGLWSAFGERAVVLGAAGLVQAPRRESYRFSSAGWGPRQRLDRLTRIARMGRRPAEVVILRADLSPLSRLHTVGLFQPAYAASRLPQGGVEEKVKLLIDGLSTKINLSARSFACSSTHRGSIRPTRPRATCPTC